MAKIRKVQRGESTWAYYFICPGCDQEHVFDDRWQFNNDLDNPTISPSYLITYDHSSKENNQKCRDFYKKHNRRPTRKEVPYDLHDRCHSFIKNGKIQFLGDCTHDLKGQTIEMKEIATNP